MKRNDPIATRWRDSVSPSEAPQNACFADLQDFGEPSAVAVAKLQHRLGAASHPAKRWLSLPRFGFAVACGLVASTALAVVWQGSHKTPIAAAVSPPTEPTPSQPLTPVAVPLPAQAPVEPVARRTISASAPPSVDSLAKETELLGQALARLRQGDDPQGALRMLQSYSKTFPKGVFAAEAKTAQVDALLALGRKPQALTLLMRFDLAKWPRGTELRLLRAELLAGKGDCVAARKDFAIVLSNTKVAAVRARAERGQAQCTIAPQ